MKKQVLIINKDMQVCYEIQRVLGSATTQVVITSDLDKAIRLFVRQDFCLIIMDAALSETDGYHYLRIILYIDLKPTEHSHYTLAFGKNFIIEPLKRQVIVHDRMIDLTRKEFDLLFCLASHPGQVLSREQLYSQIWDTDTAFDVDEIVKSHIKTLRKKLAGSDIDYIKNVWGVGYRFDTEKVSK